MTNKHEVIQLNRENPDWDDLPIAEKLGCRSEYVRAVGIREHLSIHPRYLRAEPGQKLVGPEGQWLYAREED